MTSLSLSTIEFLAFECFYQKSPSGGLTILNIQNITVMSHKTPLFQQKIYKFGGPRQKKTFFKIPASS